ncbi:MAG: glycosyltransferase [Candidatus Abyssobacteria bacterium SURF_5]|uniref:Glycosyltransferase n=1 Tax=Abyssobacteria bacterium (strain SURF_5) TaxID=2093360 RepID=A0A3A4NUA3_ABYX5|nr:MAG: glycosyltransferase [Candidatus Abyssubacteria bacterium SURF_5]
MIDEIFFISFFLLLYPVFLYPVCMLLLYNLRRRPIIRNPFPGKVTVIITAHNEESKIRDKLENTLNQDFPHERLQILVASDFSTDATDSIVGAYAERGVTLIRPDRRGGKEYAQKYAVGKATGDVIVFSDVGTELEIGGISRITSNFADPTVGCVSSRDVFLAPGRAVSGEGIYVRYEMLLRKLETGAHSVVGLSGSFFAARTNICAGIRTDTQSDFQTLLNAVRLGYRGVADPQAIGYYRELAAPHNELRRKIRTVLRGITTLMTNADLLNPLQFGLFSFQLISHKLLRWLVPLFLFLMLITSAAGAFDSALFRLAFLAQCVAYALALAAFLNRRISRIGPMALFRYGLISNIGIIVAWLKFLRGERIVYWEPSKR